MKIYVGSYDSKMYPKEAVLKAAYSFIDNYYIKLYMEEDTYKVEFYPKKDNYASQVVQEFENELLAATVRYKVYQRTHVIREVMLARAMASTMIMDEPMEILGSDVEENESLESILKDWYDEE